MDLPVTDVSDNDDDGDDDDEDGKTDDSVDVEEVYIYFTLISVFFNFYFLKCLDVHASGDEFSPDEDSMEVGRYDSVMRRHDYSDVSSTHSDDSDATFVSDISQREPSPAVPGAILSL